MVGLVERAIATDSLSPDADAQLSKSFSDLGVKPDITGDLLVRLNHARTHWKIANAPLPIIQAPLSLQRGEVAYGAVSANAFQNATRTKSVSYGGPALRVRIAKGLYYRTGHYQVHRHTESYEKQLGHGALVITNKRLIFVGATGSTTARLDSILHIEPFTNAVAIIRGTGKPTTYRFDTPDQWFCAILARAIHDATAEPADLIS